MGNYGGLALGIVGAVVGSFFGAPYIGYAVGSLLGNALFPVELDPVKVEGPKLGDLRVQGSSYGQPLGNVYGAVRKTGQLIWSTAIQQTTHTQTQTQGGKGGPTQEVTQTTYTYSISCAVAICEGVIAGVRRIWANNELIYNIDANGSFETYSKSLHDARGIRIYPGTNTQEVDTLIAATESGPVSAYRDTAYIVFDTLQLAKFGNRLPNFEFEVVSEGTIGATFTYLDAQDQFGTKADGSITPDGMLIMYYILPGGTTSKLVQVNPFTLQVLRTFDPTPFMAGGIVSSQAPQMNSRGDIAFQDNVNPNLWIWLAGANPVKVGVQVYSRISMDENGNFFCLMQHTAGNLALVRIPAGTTNIEVVAPIAGGNPRDLFDARDGYIYISYTFTGGGYVQKIRRIDGVLIAQFNDAAMVPNTICAASDASVWYVTGGSGVDQELWRIAPDFSSQTKILDENGTHTGAGSVRLGRDWLTGDILYADESGLRRYRPDGTLVRLISGPVTFRVATNPAFPERIYAFNPVQAAAGVNRFVAVAREYSMDVLPITLGEIVTDICERAGVQPAQLDVSALSDEVRGYVWSGRMEARRALEPVMGAFFSEMVESANVLKFVKRGQASVATIAQSDMGAHMTDAQLADPLQIKRAQEPELPHEIALNYLDVDANYLVGTQYSRRLTGGSFNDVSINMPIVLTANEAKRIVDAMLYEAWVQRSRYEVPLSRKYALLEPTDVVDLVLDENTYTARLRTKQEGQGLVQFEGTGYDASIYTQATPGSPVPSGTTSVGADSPTNLLLLDIPLLRDQDDTYGFYSVAGPLAGRWSGAKLFKSADALLYADTGVSYPTAGSIGYSATALADFGGGNVFDQVNTVDVSLSSGSLASHTELEVLNGLNAAYLGGEIIQFKNATLLSTGVYRLSLLLRGRLGTEWAMRKHIVGESFALLSLEPLRRVDAPAADFGVVRYYKGVTFNTLLEQAAAKNLVLQAVCLKPLSPVRVTGSRDGSNNVTFTWIRRARKSQGWANYVDVPLDEPTESYEVDVFAGTAASITAVSRAIDAVFTTSAAHGYVVNDRIYIRAAGGMLALNERPYTVTSVPASNTFTVGEDTSGYPAYTGSGLAYKRGRIISSLVTSATYSAANQTSDYGSAQNPIYAAVYQISSRVGRGYPGTGVV